MLASSKVFSAERALLEFPLFPSSAWASSTLRQSFSSPARQAWSTPMASPSAPQCLTWAPTFPGDTAILMSYISNASSLPACTLYIPSPGKCLGNSIPHLSPESPLQCSPNLSPHVYSHTRDLCLCTFPLISASCCNLVIILPPNTDPIQNSSHSAFGIIWPSIKHHTILSLTHIPTEPHSFMSPKP